MRLQAYSNPRAAHRIAAGQTRAQCRSRAAPLRPPSDTRRPGPVAVSASGSQ